MLMQVSRRGSLLLAAGAVALPIEPCIALGVDYPARSVHIVVGFPAGTAADVIIRLIAHSLAERLREPFLVDNKPGAGSNVAAETVVRAPGDGYALLTVTLTNAVNATLYKSLNFDLVHDVAPVVGVFRAPTVMVVTTSFPAKTVPEFIAYAKANPGKINYASAGYGTVGNLAGELFNARAGVKLVHVPYRSSFFPDLLSGQVQLTFAPLAPVIGAIQAGKLRALAVTGATPSNALPSIPTVSEFVPGYEVNIWVGIGAPRSIPGEIISKLNDNINTILADPNTKERFGRLGGAVLGGSPADFGNLIANETAKWARIIREANIKLD
jgi:tripartite-type tricarboxylate transporter receptor subunit TctC